MSPDTINTAAEADIDDIVQSLASMCLGMEAMRLPPGIDMPGHEQDAMLTASVSITGAWSGGVSVSCSPGLARRAAVAMFGTAREVTDDEARDALREIANIIGGNFKSLVSTPARVSRLSLPELRERALGSCGNVPVHRLWFDCEGDLLLVSVLAQPDDESGAVVAGEAELESGK